MAKVTNYDGLSQIQASLDKYFSQHLAGVLLNEKKAAEKKQSQLEKEIYASCAKKYKEEDEKLAKQGGLGAGVKPSLKAAWKEIEKKSNPKELVASYIKSAMDKFWISNKNDIGTFIQATYLELKKMHPRENDDLLKKNALSYVQHEIEEMVYKQLARNKVPKSSLEYVFKNGIKSSFIGWIDSFSLSDAEKKIEQKANELYNPSSKEEAARLGVTFATDAVTFGGYAKTAKGAAWFATDVAAQSWGMASSKKNYNNERYLKDNAKLIFGDEDAIKKIEDGAKKYQRHAGSMQYELNAYLDKKVKNLGTPTMAAATINNRNNLLCKHKGNSSNLLKDIKSSFSKQAIPYNGKPTPPAWMSKLSEKETRRMASYYYGLTMEMSKSRREVMYVGGKKMTLKEIAQKAIDYGTVASGHQAKREALYYQAKEQQRVAAEKKRYYEESRRASSSTYDTSSQQPQQMQQVQQAQQGANNQASLDGWSNSLDQLGLGGFSETTKNLGYVLAMLPDMLIGMFTGKNPDLKMEDNLMPLAAIAGGLLVKRNPLLRMVLLGYGGLNIFNSAGKAALKQQAEAVAPKVYKTYEDQPLNERVKQPVLKGNSLLATIDGNPVVIKINDEVIDAYQKGHIPLNTLVNRVLSKFDENNNRAAQQYEQGVVKQEEEVKTNRQLK